jgi:hypothetical protein
MLNLNCASWGAGGRRFKSSRPDHQIKGFRQGGLFHFWASGELRLDIGLMETMTCSDMPAYYVQATQR